MQQIIALGGGGFSMEPDNQALDKYIVEQAGQARPKVCFLPSATDDAVRYIRNFYEAFTKLDTRPTYLSLFTPPTADLESFLLDQDVTMLGVAIPKACWPCGVSGNSTPSCAKHGSRA
jgi:dipeptidase E